MDFQPRISNLLSFPVLCLGRSTGRGCSGTELKQTECPGENLRVHLSDRELVDGDVCSIYTPSDSPAERISPHRNHL